MLIYMRFDNKEYIYHIERKEISIMKRKILAITLSLAMVLGLCACGGKEEEVIEETVEVVEEAAPAPTVEPTPAPTEEPSIVEEVVEEVFDSKYPRSFGQISDEDMSWLINEGRKSIDEYWENVTNSEIVLGYIIAFEKGDTTTELYLVYETLFEDGSTRYTTAWQRTFEFGEDKNINRIYMEQNLTPFGHGKLEITSYDKDKIKEEITERSGVYFIDEKEF